MNDADFNRPVKLGEFHQYEARCNARFDKLEQGQTNLQQSVTNLQQGQARLEKRCDALQQSVTDLQQGQTDLQQGQARLEKRCDALQQGQTDLAVAVAGIQASNALIVKLLITLVGIVGTGLVAAVVSAFAPALERAAVETVRAATAVGQAAWSWVATLLA